ncbi:MAG: HEAT repeat domain-containing protein [Myxococcota bacterium]|nr:HEAT repeat domain-containing protein [Myxococcota bacterium]
MNAHFPALGAARLRRFLLLALIALLTLSFAEASARRRKRRRAPTPPPSPIDSATLEQLRPLLDRLATRADEGVKRAVFEARLLMEQSDRDAAVDAAIATADLELQLAAVRWILSDKARAGARYEAGLKFLREHLHSNKAERRAVGYKLLDQFFPEQATPTSRKRRRRRRRRRRGAAPLSRLSLIQEAAKIGQPEARKTARALIFARQDELSWALVQEGLGKSGDPLYTEALAALEAKAYPEAKSWAMKRIYEDGEEGRVARVWFSKVEGVRGLDQKLKQLYKRLYGNFEKRVRLANLLAHRGHFSLVRDTLVFAVGSSRSNNPTVRALGWEGLQVCREKLLLEKFKIFFLAISNEVENRPAAIWLREWFKETGEPIAMQILLEMAKSTRYATRAAALQVLGELEHRKSMPMIEEVLRGGDLRMRKVAAEAIATMARRGDERRFRKYLRQERRDVGIRVTLLEALGRLGTKDALSVIRFYLPERDPVLRRAAVEALTHIEGVEIGELLTGRLRLDPDLQIRYRVWELLLTRDPKRLGRAMKSAAVWVTPEMVEKLSALPKVPVNFFAEVALNAPTNKRALRMAAVEALNQRGAAGLVSLKRIIDQSPGDFVNGAAVDRVGSQLKLEALGTYRRLLERREGALRAAAYRNIGLYGPVAQLERMKQGYEDDEPVVRAEATRAVLNPMHRQAKAAPSR